MVLLASILRYACICRTSSVANGGVGNILLPPLLVKQFLKTGALGGTRTPNQRSRNPLHYPIVLRAQKLNQLLPLVRT